MKDFRVIARLYNNRLRERREATGLTACAFAVRAGVQPSTYCAYESLKESPVCKKHKAKAWRPSAKKIATALDVDPSDLWPDSMLEIKQAVAERRLNAEEVGSLLAAPSGASPFGLLAAAEEKQAVVEAVMSLGERERDVVISRYVNEEGLDEIGERWQVSRERIRQIGMRGLRAVAFRVKGVVDV